MLQFNVDFFPPSVLFGIPVSNRAMIKAPPDPEDTLSCQEVWHFSVAYVKANTILVALAESCFQLKWHMY